MLQQELKEFKKKKLFFENIKAHTLTHTDISKSCKYVLARVSGVTFTSK